MLVQSKARLRYVSIPPRKMRLVADMIKGMPVQKALDILNFTPKIAARHIAKTVSSAAANALSVEGTDKLRPEDLMVKNILVDAAPTQKRIRFQSMGRVFRYRKRFCHLTVLLEGHLEEEVQDKKATKAKAKAAKVEETVEAEEEPKAKKAAKKTTKKKTAKAKKAEKPAEAEEVVAEEAAVEEKVEEKVEAAAEAPEKTAEPKAEEADGAEEDKDSDKSDKE